MYSSYSSSSAASSSASSSTSCDSWACSRIPSLDEILNDTAPEPYNLDAFYEYLSHNHCQEVLEFALDCEKYSKSYYGWNNNNNSNSLQYAACKTSVILHHAWNCIMDQYIKQDSPKEINISCSVRGGLLKFSTAGRREPIHPSHLNMALQQAKDLMKENALLQFITNAKFTRPLQHSIQHDKSKFSKSSTSVSSLPGSSSPDYRSQTFCHKSTSNDGRLPARLVTTNDAKYSSSSLKFGNNNPQKRFSASIISRKMGQKLKLFK